MSMAAAAGSVAGRRLTLRSLHCKTLLLLLLSVSSLLRLQLDLRVAMQGGQRLR
jgi:hypothetical protein